MRCDTHAPCCTAPEAATAAPCTPDPPEPQDRELAVLEELSREDEAWVAFQGLKRELGLHQQQLSRTLTRLERDGLIAADETGYRLTEDGFQTVAAHGQPGPRCGEAPVAQVLLPPGLEPEVVADDLATRWFDGLRWYGRTGGPGETTLIWQTEPTGRRVRLRIGGGMLTVTVDPCIEPDGAVYRAVHTLLREATAGYGDNGAAAG